MRLCDHFRMPVSGHWAWEVFHHGWAMMIVASAHLEEILRRLRPPHFNRQDIP